MSTLTIKEITNMYHQKDVEWKRDTYAPRAFDAIVFFEDGKIDYHFDRASITAQKGDYLFLPRNVPYSGEMRSNTVSYFVLDFLCAEETAFAQFPAPSVFTPSNYALQIYNFSTMLKSWNMQKINRQFQAKAFVYSLLSEVLEEPHATRATAPITEILEYVVENLEDPSLKVSTLCEKFFISESQLRRNFLKATSLSPNQYILTLRINKAKNELSGTEKSIAQIASDCGFTSPYYFSRCFSEVENTTPTAYRKQNLSLFL